MAKKKRSGRRNQKIPIAASLGAAAFAWNAYSGYKAQGVPGMVLNTIGVDAKGNFNSSYLKKGMVPLGIGVGISMLASKTGANRYISKIPFVKI